MHTMLGFSILDVPLTWPLMEACSTPFEPMVALSSLKTDPKEKSLELVSSNFDVASLGDDWDLPYYTMFWWYYASDKTCFLWESVAKRGFSLIGKGTEIKLQDKEGRNILWAKEISGSHVIQLVEDVARFSSYEVWHQALGHPSVSNMNTETNNPYTNSHLIPKPPKNFHCNACALSKITHHKPAESMRYNKATKCFELIHIDLSG